MPKAVRHRFASTKLASGQQSLSVGKGTKGVRMWLPGNAVHLDGEAKVYSFSGEEVWQFLIKLKMLLSTVQCLPSPHSACSCKN